MRLTQSLLKSLLHYDHTTGVFTNVASRGGAKIGGIAGTVSGAQGYRRIKINGKLYKAHRLAFLWMTGCFPANHVDHINGQTDDNRWDNLRSTTSSQNSRNAKRSHKNQSGCTGVYFAATYNYWRAQIRFNGKQNHLGTFSHIFDAACARKSAELKYGYHANHGR